MPIIVGNPGQQPFTVGNLIDRIFRLAPRNAVIDTLSIALPTGVAYAQTTLTVTDVNRWGAGQIAEIDQEQFFIISVNQANSTALCYRGWAGTTPTSHAITTPVYLNSRFTRLDAFNAVQDAIRNLAPPLFQIASVEFTTGAFSSYDLVGVTASSFLDVYEIWFQEDPTDASWREIVGFDTMIGMSSADGFPSTLALILFEPVLSKKTLKVFYRSTFTTPVFETDDLSQTVGMQEFMFNLPVYYAVSRLVPPEEVLRIRPFTPSSSNRGEQTPVRSALSVADYYYNLYQVELQESKKRLSALYPTRVRVRSR